jgi:hypothetical protein
MTAKPCGCISRDDMPQVDKADMPNLFFWLHQHGIKVFGSEVNPDDIRGHQKVYRPIVKDMPDEALSKPILVSNDGIVVDGNHRWAAAHYRRKETMPAYVIDKDFDTALSLVKEYPKSYTYGDGQFHPITD